MELLTDELWQRMSIHLPADRRRPQDLAALNGILWKLETCAGWQDLPRRYPSYSTCWRRYTEWRRSGALAEVLCELEDEVASSADRFGANGSADDARAENGHRIDRAIRAQQIERLLQSPEVERLMLSAARRSVGDLSRGVS